MTTTVAAGPVSLVESGNTAQAEEVTPYPMGPLDAAFLQIGERFDGDGTSVISTQIRGTIQPELLRGALAVAQKRHPRLRARIGKGSDGKPCYEMLSAMTPLELRIKDVDADPLPWAEESLSLVAEHFDLSAGPLCRVVLLRNQRQSLNELIFAMHHSLADVGSGAQLTHDVLRNYELLASGQTLEELMRTTEPLPFVAAEIPPITAPLRDRLAMIKRLVRGYLRKRRRSWTPLPNDSTDYRPHWSRYVLSTEDSAKLMRICRKKRLLAYGAIFAAAVTSLADCLEGKRFDFICRCPVNARELPGCPRTISTEQLGCFVSGLDNLYTISKPAAFWDLARQACDDMRVFVSKQGPAMALSMLPMAGKLATWLRISPKRPPMRDTMSVNFIPCPMIKERYGDLTVAALSGINRTRYMGVSLMVGATVVNGRVNFSLGAIDVSDSLRQQFHARFFDTLQRVIRGEI